MTKRLLSLGLAAVTVIGTSMIAVAGDYDYEYPAGPGYDYGRPAPRGYGYGHPRYRSHPVYGGYVNARPWAPHNGGRDAADPAYASPDSQPYFNPSVGNKTGTYADDGASGE